MSNFDRAIEIIMAQPPELHYPAYFADLLRKADVPDKDVGKCSEKPNGSNLISRKEALKAVSWDTEAYMAINMLPSAEPETSILTVTVNPDSEEIEKVARKIKDAPVMMLPSAQPEPLTDREQRLFLSAMAREEKVCKQVDDDFRYCRESYEEPLVRACKEIVRKVKGALWTN